MATYQQDLDINDTPYLLDLVASRSDSYYKIEGGLPYDRGNLMTWILEGSVSWVRLDQVRRGHANVVATMGDQKYIARITPSAIRHEHRI